MVLPLDDAPRLSLRPPPATPTGDRLPGWEMRLAGVIRAAWSLPFRWGSHDCFLFACADVEALVGVDLAKPWRGRYTTERGALAFIAEFGTTWTGAFTRLFGAAPVPMAQAHRGDIADFVHDGRHHLGVVIGSKVAVLGEHRMDYVARGACAAAWRIG